MTTKTAAALTIGDMVATRDGKFRKVTGVDITPAAVRVRTGRSQYWMRCEPNSVFEVAS